jgi:hypothetical protein
MGSMKVEKKRKRKRANRRKTELPGDTVTAWPNEVYT